jgi:hypothetical protein
MDSDQIIIMTTREAERFEIIQKLITGTIDGSEAAKLMNLSVRQTKRIKARVKAAKSKEKIRSIIHGNRGKPSNRKLDEELIKKAEELLITKYPDFNPLLAQEKLFEIDKIKLSSEKVRQLMITQKLWKPKRRHEAKKFAWRERKDNYGEMQQFDGSYHNWFEGRNEVEVGLEQCLLLSVDDATGKITGAEFHYHEGVVPVFTFWKNYILENGLPLAIYLDKFSTYKVNHKNAVDNKELMTQFQRAMEKQFNVRVIHAHTPQAKGRVEKMNSTLQRRLVKELRLAKINTIAEANMFLKEIFIPKFNEKFAVLAKKASDLHRKLSEKQLTEIDSVLSIQSVRTINNDYTVRFKSNYYQLEEIQPTTVYKKSKVDIEERLNGELKIKVRGHELVYFQLPEKPKKEIDIKLPALTIRKSTAHTPPDGHPWKQMMLREWTKKKQLQHATA